MSTYKKKTRGRRRRARVPKAAGPAELTLVAEPTDDAATEPPLESVVAEADIVDSRDVDHAVAAQAAHANGSNGHNGVNGSNRLSGATADTVKRRIRNWSPSPPKPPSEVKVKGKRETTGLRDIRRLASQHVHREEEEEDLNLLLGAVAQPNMAAPTMVFAPPERTPRWMVLTLAGLSGGMLAATGLLVALALGWSPAKSLKSKQRPPIENPAPKEPTPAEPADKTAPIAREIAPAAETELAIEQGAAIAEPTEEANSKSDPLAFLRSSVFDRALASPKSEAGSDKSAKARND